MSMIQTARGSGATASEGAVSGNVMLSISLNRIDGNWPNFPTPQPGITVGGMMTAKLFGANLGTDPGWWQGQGELLIEGGGSILLDGANVTFNYHLDANGKITDLRGEGIDPEGHFFAVVTTNAPVTPMNGFSNLQVELVRSAQAVAKAAA